MAKKYKVPEDRIVLKALGDSLWLRKTLSKTNGEISSGLRGLLNDIQQKCREVAWDRIYELTPANSAQQCRLRLEGPDLFVDVLNGDDVEGGESKDEDGDDDPRPHPLGSGGHGPPVPRLSLN